MDNEAISAGANSYYRLTDAVFPMTRIKPSSTEYQKSEKGRVRVDLTDSRFLALFSQEVNWPNAAAKGHATHGSGGGQKELSDTAVVALIKAVKLQLLGLIHARVDANTVCNR